MMIVANASTASTVLRSLSRCEMVCCNATSLTWRNWLAVVALRSHIWVNVARSAATTAATSTVGRPSATGARFWVAVAYAAVAVARLLAIPVSPSGGSVLMTTLA